MPWNVLDLTENDKDVLRSFLTKKQDEQDNIQYLELIQHWRSTNEINVKLYEPRKRTKDRLLKLKGFGLLKLKGFQKGKRWDNYWYISDGGVYYLLSTFRRPASIKFLEANSSIREFEFIKKLMLEKRPEVDYLIHEIKNRVKNYQYNMISRLVNNWFKDVCGRNFVRMPLEPSIYATLNQTSRKKNYKINNPAWSLR